MPQMWNAKEHRWGERVRVNIQVQVSPGSEAGIDGRIENLSLSGALMKVDWEPQVNSLIEVIIRRAPPSHHTMCVKARVARTVKGQFGVEWCDFAPSAVKDLLHSPFPRLHGLL